MNFHRELCKRLETQQNDMLRHRTKLTEIDRDKAKNIAARMRRDLQRPSIIIDVLERIET